ncbi:MAG: hypothetical protein GY796_17305 [Chloroflexi bacterium]|nr:hypothetical protein [Chloroflexota bacterium]
MDVLLATSNEHKAQAAQSVLGRRVQHIKLDLPEIQTFDEFVGAIHLPHASDSFSHIEGMLPQETAVALNGIERRPRRTRRKTPS